MAAVVGVVAVGIPARDDVFGEREAQKPPSAKAFFTGPVMVESGVAGPAETISQRGRGMLGDAVSMRGRWAGRSGCEPVDAVSNEEL
jgi:hypothetical protein